MSTWYDGLIGSIPTIAIVFGMMYGYLKFIRAETRSIIQQDAITQSDYRKDQAAMWQEINQIKRFEAEFGIIKTQVAHVQSDVSEVKLDVKSLSKEITGAIVRASKMNQ